MYRLTAVHCQMTRYSQRVLGYLTRYSVSANEISFDKKNQPIRLCLSNQVRPGREWFPSPLSDFNRLFEGLIGELFKIYYIETCFIFLNGISLAHKMQICIIAVLVKASWMQCPLYNQKVNNPSFHGASCQLEPFNSQPIRTHKVQYLPTAV